MAKGKKYYVVWQGLNPGIYENWADCKEQVNGQPNAKYKSFETRESAEEALERGFAAYLKSHPSPKAVFEKMMRQEPAIGKPIRESLAVDAACSGNPGDMEYRGVYVATGNEIFHVGPMPRGTNNIGEFLAIVHALALLKQKNSSMPIYSDSKIAMLWVSKKQCKTKLELNAKTAPLYDLIKRAENWLKNNSYNTRIIKWKTEIWGEIPADFGRK